MKDKFRYIDFIVVVIRYITILTIGGGILAPFSKFYGDKTDAHFAIGIFISAIFLFVLGELLNIVAEIEKNTRKD